jgi:hypothetical protein
MRTKLSGIKYCIAYSDFQINTCRVLRMVDTSLFRAGSQEETDRLRLFDLSPTDVIFTRPMAWLGR